MSDSTPTPEAKPDWQERALSAEARLAEQTDLVLETARRVMSLNIHNLQLVGALEEIGCEQSAETATAAADKFQEIAKAALSGDGVAKHRGYMAAVDAFIAAYELKPGERIVEARAAIQSTGEKG